MANPPQWLRSLKNIVFSQRIIPIMKGAIAYTLAFILIFSFEFDRLSKYPQTLVSMMIVVAAGGPGKAIGAVVTSALLGSAGLLVGCFNFYILAILSPWVVAQAVYFFVAVYAIGYVKTFGLKWFGPTIFAILISFNGIYTSKLLGNHFDKNYLLEYLKSYLWGFAINLAVACIVFPVSSEKELRKTLLMSLQHIETFGMLISRSYLCIITDDERKIRDELAQTIRADFGFLMQKLEETTVEINWSKWSLEDYRYFIHKTRALQLSLISAHSSLASLEKTDDAFYKTAFIPKTLGVFNRVRVDMRVTIREIERVFGFEGVVLPRCDWDVYHDIERQVVETTGPDAVRERNGSFTGMTADPLRDEELRAVAQRLAAEFENGPQDDDDSIDRSSDATVPRRGMHSYSPSGSATPVASTHVGGTITPHTPRVPDEQETKRVLQDRGPQALAHDFAVFDAVQHEIIARVLTSGTLTDCSGPMKLKIHSPQPSVYEAYGHDYVRGRRQAEAAKSVETTPAPTIRKRKVRTRQADDEADEKAGEKVDRDEEDEYQEDEEEDTANSLAIAGDHSLIRIYSMLFALSQYAKELREFHTRASALDAKGRPKSRRLHFHFFESLKHPQGATSTQANPEVRDLPLAEALAVLEGKEYQPRKISVWRRVDRFKRWLLGQDSLYAFKTAAATTVFAIFLYANTTRPWFISYSLTSGLITVVVALAPTLGQSALTFVLQIAGSALGYLIGLALLSIFHNVGGYVYNPYGIACLVFLYCLPLQYIIYEKPKYFTLALLALNGTGVLIGTEWIYRDFYKRTFDSPAYRTGKALTGLSVALGVVTVFQLFVARNPARRTLRLALADITNSNLSYMVMLQAFVRAMVPADPTQKADPAAVARVHKELIRRELQIQGKIIGVMPLLLFAGVEPSFAQKFDPKPHMRIIKANQVILDRLREGRGAIGTTPFSDVFLTEFVAPLSPYRRRATRINKACLGASAAAMTSRLPVPSDISTTELTSILPDFLHDALVLSHRFAQTEEGREAVRSGEFTRYWFYVLSATSIFPALKDIREVCHQLYGSLEDSLV